MADANEDPFARLNAAASDVLRRMSENNSQTALRDVGPVFSDTNTSRSTVPVKKRPGNKPTRTFVWIGSRNDTEINGTDLSNLVGKKIKFDSQLDAKAMSSLLKREIQEIKNAITHNIWMSAAKETDAVTA